MHSSESEGDSTVGSEAEIVISAGDGVRESNGKTEEEADSLWDNGFGEKKISGYGGFCLLVNNITGPALTTIPPLYQQAGWFTPSFFMILVCVCSTLVSTMLIEAMALLPGNSEFQARAELSTLIARYFPTKRWFFWVVNMLLNISLTALNVSSIIVSAQTMDFVLIAIFGWTGGLEFYPDFGFHDATKAGSGITPFGNDVYILTLGFIIVLALAIPLGFFPLESSIIVQIFSFWIMVFIFVIWFVLWTVKGYNFDLIPVIGENQTQVLGQVIFNFAYVTSIPSWINEAAPGTKINKTVWWGVITSTLMYLFLGFFGGWAAKYPGDDDILNIMGDWKGDGVTHAAAITADVTAYVFPVITLLSGIPIYSIIIRYNLIENKLCNKHWANFWGVILPWIISVPFYTGAGLDEVINWTSLFVNGVINFIIPPIIYMKAKELEDSGRLHTVAVAAVVAVVKGGGSDVDAEEVVQYGSVGHYGSINESKADTSAYDQHDAPDDLSSPSEHQSLLYAGETEYDPDAYRAVPRCLERFPYPYRKHPSWNLAAFIIILLGLLNIAVIILNFVELGLGNDLQGG